MTAQRLSYRLVGLTILAVALAAPGWLGAPLAAAPLDKLDTSLKFIPEDAAFYSSMLRNREQFEAIRKSNAWAKIAAMPVVQMGMSWYQAQTQRADSGPAKFDAALKNPEIRKIIDLAVDMVSDDVFVYGDDSCIDFLQLVQNVYGATQYAPLVVQATGKAEGRSLEQLKVRALVSALAEHADLIDAPNVVVGFKVKNADLAKEQLIKMETIGNIMLEANELTKGHFKKTKVGKHEFLVLELDGEMVPWDKVPMDQLKAMEPTQGDFQKIIDKLKEAKLVLAIGLRDNYLVCSLGSSLECLEKLGQGKRLMDRAELKPLAKFADRRLTAICYLSEEMFQQLNSQRRNIDEMLKLADKLLPLAKLTDQQNQRIRKDAQAMAKEVKDLVPEVGAVLGFRFLSDRGIEHYRYVWGEHPWIDGGKPLGLLKHIGGNPILAAVARGKTSPADYDRMTKWVKTAYGYFNELALPHVPEGDREKINKFLKAALPLVERMDKANREMLIPALADGQVALVIDGKLTSKHFIESLPATDKPMPMAEPAIVMGVSDAKLLKHGLCEYRAVINGLIDVARQVEGSNVPANVQIPKPQTTEGPLGTIYSFPLPKPWGVDEKILPNLGVSSEAFVLSVSRDHTERLLKATPLKVGGLLAKSDRPLAVAVWFDWAALVDAATPWADFGLGQAAAHGSIPEDQQKATVQQVHTALEVLKSLRSISSETCLEDDALVTHTLAEIRDIEK
jgi:hypothetical protein